MLKSEFRQEHMETLDRMPFKARKAVFEKLEQISDLASLSREDRIKYDASLKAYRDYLATTRSAERKGREEGIEIGERNKQVAIARNMIAKGMAVDIIAEFTGLSAEEIEKL